MSDKPFDDLPPFVREALAAEEARESEIRKTAEALAALGGLGKPEPSAKGRARLLATVSTGPERYGPFFSKVARIVDLGLEKIEAVFAEAEDRTKWEAGPFPGIELFHFAGGPAAAHADTGFIRFAPGFVFPEHKHLGREVVMLLEGAYLDSSGRLYCAGDI